MAISSEKSAVVFPGKRFLTTGWTAQSSLMAEFGDFLLNCKAWWLTPIVVVKPGLGTLVILSGSSVAPILYTIW